MSAGESKRSRMHVGSPQMCRWFPAASSFCHGPLQAHRHQPAVPPVDLAQQLLPGTFEHAMHHLLTHAVDLAAFDARFRNDATGGLERAKTDRVDAGVLARYAERVRPEVRAAPMTRLTIRNTMVREGTTWSPPPAPTT